MFSFEHTELWRKTLASQIDDPHEQFRSDLRNSFLNVRARVEALVSNIHSDFRDYTVHDITHIDALGGIADKIAGDKIPFTPLEAFVLGCAFLFHDAGMTLAAYPNGISDLRKHQLWPNVEQKNSAGAPGRSYRYT